MLRRRSAPSSALHATSTASSSTCRGITSVDVCGLLIDLSELGAVTLRNAPIEIRRTLTSLARSQ